MHRAPSLFHVIFGVLLTGAIVAPVAGAQTPTLLRTWGTVGTGPGQFSNPFGVALDGAGHIYVTDQQNNRVQKFTASGEFVLAWGSWGTEPGQLRYPTGIDVSPNGEVIVADYDRVCRFTPTGACIACFGVARHSYALTTDPYGNIYVASAGDEWQKFSPEGGLLLTYSAPMGTPYGIAVDALGRVYVAGQSDGHIRVFDQAPAPLWEFGGLGTAPGQLNYPEGLTFDRDGVLYVADHRNDRIQQFASGGTLVSVWGDSGSGPGQLLGPTDIAIDGSGNCYVADYYNNRIQVFGAGPTPARRESVGSVKVRYR